MSKSKAIATVAALTVFTATAFADETVEVEFLYDDALTAEQNLSVITETAKDVCSDLYSDATTLLFTKSIRIRECKAELTAKAVKGFNNELLDAVYAGKPLSVEFAALK